MTTFLTAHIANWGEQTNQGVLTVHGCHFVSRWPEQLMPHLTVLVLFQCQDLEQIHLCRQIIQNPGREAILLSIADSQCCNLQAWVSILICCSQGKLPFTLPIGDVPSCNERDWAKFSFVPTGESSGCKDWIWRHTGSSSNPSLATYFFSKLQFSRP